MAVRYSKGEVVMMTPSMARTILSDIGEDGPQRDLRKAHVLHLIRLITEGLFISTGSVALAKINGVTVIGNGQHTLHAIVASGIGVRVCLDRFVCDSPEDFAQLFHSYDTENRNRTFRESASNFLWSHAADLPRMTPTQLQTFQSGANYAEYILGDRSGVRKTRRELFEPVLSLRAAGDCWAGLSAHTEAWHLMRRTAVVAAFILTYRHGSEMCAEFWGKVATGHSGTMAYDPLYPPIKLRSWLQSNRPVLGSGANPTKAHIVGRPETYNACVIAYNYYIHGCRLRLIALHHKLDKVTVGSKPPRRTPRTSEV